MQEWAKNQMQISIKLLLWLVYLSSQFVADSKIGHKEGEKNNAPPPKKEALIK